MKNFIRISSLALLLAAGFGLPASAAIEEDAAAPIGSFTSDMAVPAPHGRFAAHANGWACAPRHGHIQAHVQRPYSTIE